MCKKEKLRPISELGEFGLIDHLTNDIVHVQSGTAKGIGDDAAVIDHSEYQTLVSTDLLLEGIHFDLMYTPLKHLGYKAVVVNASDIYAMNGTPKQITLGLGLSSKFSVEAVESFYEGVKLACQQYEIDLIGGDTSASNQGLIISVTVLGEAEKTQIAYRDTATVGDHICVTGNLGAAFMGLQIMEREKQVFIEHPEMQPDLDTHKYLVERILKPEAKKDIIALLDKLDIVPTAMIDLSDGLSSDLMHICKQSDVGAIIFEENVPIHPDTARQALEFNLSPTTCALNGGEDYELLFTVSPDQYRHLEGAPDITMIGKVVDKSEGINIYTKDSKKHALTAQGWQHV